MVQDRVHRTKVIYYLHKFLPISILQAGSPLPFCKRQEAERTAVAEVENYLIQHDDQVSVPFTAQSFTLYESHLGKKTSQYIKREEYALKPAPGTEEDQ
jgi:hypothetical protein